MSQFKVRVLFSTAEKPPFSLHLLQCMSITACQTNHTLNTLHEGDLIVGRLSLSECSDLKHCSIYDYRQGSNCVNKSLKYNPVKAVGSYTLRITHYGQLLPMLARRSGFRS